jgi:uncharacterized Zn finger protein
MANNILKESTAASQNDLKHASALLYLHASEIAEDEFEIFEILCPSKQFCQEIPVIDRSKKQVRAKRVLALAETKIDDNEQPTPTAAAVKKVTNKETVSSEKKEVVLCYEGLEEIIRVNLGLTPNVFSDVLMRRVWTTLENGYEDVKVIANGGIWCN